MNNICWRIVAKDKVWYWEREDTFNVLRTGPFSSYTACKTDAKRNGFEPDKFPKIAKRYPDRKFERKGTSSQQRAH